MNLRDKTHEAPMKEYLLGFLSGTCLENNFYSENHRNK